MYGGNEPSIKFGDYNTGIDKLATIGFEDDYFGRGALRFTVKGQANGSGLEAMRITSGGNLLVGTTTDAGEKLQVSGSAKIDGLLVSNQLLLRNNSDSEFVNIGQSTGNQKQLLVGSLYSSNIFYIQGIQQNVGYNQNLSLQKDGGNVLIGTSTNGSSKLRIVGLPTSSTGLSAGDVWNDGGTLKIV